MHLCILSFANLCKKSLSTCEISLLTIDSLTPCHYALVASCSLHAIYTVSLVAVLDYEFLNPTLNWTLFESPCETYLTLNPKLFPLLRKPFIFSLLSSLGRTSSDQRSIEAPILVFVWTSFDRGFLVQARLNDTPSRLNENTCHEIFNVKITQHLSFLLSNPFLHILLHIINQTQFQNISYNIENLIFSLKP
jgi:hypothetical protein